MTTEQLVAYALIAGMALFVIIVGTVAMLKRRRHRARMRGRKNYR